MMHPAPLIRRVRHAVYGTLRLPRALYAIALAVNGVPPAAAQECQSMGEDSFSETLDIPNELRPDIQITGWKRAAERRFGFRRCTPSASYALSFRPSMASLHYVKDISVDGLAHPAFQWSSTSPLIIFELLKYADNASGLDNRPAAVRADLPISTRMMVSRRGDVGLTLAFALFSRGGQMTDVVSPLLSAELGLSAHPGTDPLRYSLQIHARVAVATCTLRDVSQQLDPADPSSLATPDSTAEGREFAIDMECPVDGRPLSLVLIDANDFTNGSNALKPPAGSTSRGVRIQLTRDGMPLQLGAPWPYGPSQQGHQHIRLGARYLRTAGPLQPGTLEGKAILTVQYD